MGRRKRLLIDGDIPLYSIAFSVEEPVDWGDDFWTLHADMATAREAMLIWMDKVCEFTNTKQVLVALSSSNNWRRQMEPTYKANRDGRRKPVVYNPLKDFIRQRWETLEYPRLEADDVLGLLSNDLDIIVSTDKDLLGVPGRHFNPSKPEEGIKRVTEKQAYYFHMIQTLTGDTVDNYKGCPGVGPVAAKKLLDGLASEEMWPVVLKRFGKAGISEEDALVQARLAHIMWPEEYDTETEEIELWLPKE